MLRNPAFWKSFRNFQYDTPKSQSFWSNLSPCHSNLFISNFPPNLPLLWSILESHLFADLFLRHSEIPLEPHSFPLIPIAPFPFSVSIMSTFTVREEKKKRAIRAKSAAGYMCLRRRQRTFRVWQGANLGPPSAGRQSKLSLFRGDFAFLETQKTAIFYRLRRTGFMIIWPSLGVSTVSIVCRETMFMYPQPMTWLSTLLTTSTFTYFTWKHRVHVVT